jgi:hypothetical protein
MPELAFSPMPGGPLVASVVLRRFVEVDDDWLRRFDDVALAGADEPKPHAPASSAIATPAMPGAR